MKTDIQTTNGNFLEVEENETVFLLKHREKTFYYFLEKAKLVESVCDDSFYWLGEFSKYELKVSPQGASFIEKTNKLPIECPISDVYFYSDGEPISRRVLQSQIITFVPNNIMSLM